MDLNADCEFCTVHLWFASIPPLLLSVTIVAEYKPAQKGKNIFAEIFGGILVCMSISLFFLYGSRVFWKRDYDREYTNMTAELVAVELTVLTAMAGIAYSAFRILSAMMVIASIYSSVCVAVYD